MAGDNETIRLLSELQKQLAVQQEKERTIKDDLDALSQDVKSLREEVSQIRAMANRWKGGFVVLAGIGGVVGWVLSTWNSLTNLIK